MTALEQDVSLWLSTRTSADAHHAFVERYGADGPRRFARAARAIAYLKQHHEPLRAAGLLALGEQRGDVRMERAFAEELAAACEEDR